MVRVLLDNCVPARLAEHIRGAEVDTAIARGWAALDDGALLDAMVGTFDVLVTVDCNIPFQQIIARRPVGIVILRARRNRLGELARLIPDLHRVLQQIGPGEVRTIG